MRTTPDLGWNRKSIDDMLDKINEMHESGIVPPPPPRRGLFDLPVTRDALWCHAETRAQFPAVFVAALEREGVAVETNHWVPAFKIVLTGRVAERIGQMMQFDDAVKSAMKENHAFLDLLRRNGLLEQS